MKTLLQFAVCAMMVLAPGSGFAAEPPLSIAAAADLNFALTDIAARFEKQTGQQVRISFGSSGNLFMQIENGAPFDLFFSADWDYPRRLETEGLAEPGTLSRYAVGRIVLWIPAVSALQLDRRGMKALLDASVKRIAIANPSHAPYGRAAVEALHHFGVYDQVAPKLVLGESVSQAAQFVASGNAQAGIIALSLALAPGMKDKGRYWAVPAGSYAALRQGVVVLKRTPNKQVAKHFLEFLRTPESSEILKRYGFEVAQ